MLCKRNIVVTYIKHSKKVETLIMKPASYGTCMEHVWTVYGKCAKQTYGPCMENVWTLYGKCMELYGNIMGHNDVIAL